jgi:hypothetical protein
MAVAMGGGLGNPKPAEKPTSESKSLFISALVTGGEYSALEKRLLELGYPVIGRDESLREYGALRNFSAVMSKSYFALRSEGKKPRQYGYSVAVDEDIITDILLQKGYSSGKIYRKARAEIVKELEKKLQYCGTTAWLGPVMFRSDAVKLIKNVVPLAQKEFIDYLEDTYGINVGFKVSTPKKTSENSFPYQVKFYLRWMPAVE